MAGNNQLMSWHNLSAKNLGFTLIQRFGQPNYVLPGRLEWNEPYAYLKQIILIDENIPHSFPMPHNDYVYSISRINVKPEEASILSLVVENLIIDQLKGLVTARCNSLLKNQITLGFVFDYINKRLPIDDQDVNGLRKEYGNRLTNNIISTSGKFNPIYGIRKAQPTQFTQNLKQRLQSLGQSSQWLFGGT